MTKRSRRARGPAYEAHGAETGWKWIFETMPMQRAPSFPSEQHNGELKVAAEFRVEAASGDHPHGGLREISNMFRTGERPAEGTSDIYRMRTSQTPSKGRFLGSTELDQEDNGKQSPRDCSFP